MYNDNYIYEWNIDGLSEHETLNVLRQMLIAATAYLMENDDHNDTQLLISGFSGTLRSWWDNCLNEEEIKFLQTSTNDEGEQNAVHRTVYAITKHFVGDPRILQERSSEILQNLRCRMLSDFRWYHDVFISKVMIRHDARAPYWKERFLYELPRALTEKVQETLREKHRETIPYDDLTYENLINEIKKEGLKLCSQLRLRYKVKKDLKASKKDLRSFCAQHGIEMLVPPSQKHNISKYSKRKLYSNKEYSKKKYRKYKSHKSNKTTQNPTKPHKREIRCFKCGQKEHIAPNCRKQRLNVLSDSEEEYYFEDNTSSSSESNNSQNKNLIPEKYQNEIDKIENCLCQVNVLTTDQELLIEMIYQIENKEVKAKYIRKIMEQNTKATRSCPLSMLTNLRILCNNLKHKTL